MKLTVVSPRVTWNESIPQQQFNFFFAKKVMNTNRESKDTQLSSNQAFKPLAISTDVPFDPTKKIHNMCTATFTKATALIYQGST